MKWRHSKLDAKQDKNRTAQSENQDEDEEQDCVSGSASESCSSGDENEIDIEAEWQKLHLNKRNTHFHSNLFFIEVNLPEFVYFHKLRSRYKLKSWD